jgi:hypothetical protein
VLGKDWGFILEEFEDKCPHVAGTHLDFVRERHAVSIVCAHELGEETGEGTHNLVVLPGSQSPENQCNEPVHRNQLPPGKFGGLAATHGIGQPVTIPGTKVDDGVGRDIGEVRQQGPTLLAEQ